MQTKISLALAAAIAVGWFGWHAVEFVRCGDRNCAPVEGEPPLRLASGKEVDVLATRTDERGRLSVEYLSAIDRRDRRELCGEARAVWRAIVDTMDVHRVSRGELMPTNPASEFLGMSYLVVPLYTCCVTTPLAVRREAVGGWSFPDCPPD